MADVRLTVQEINRAAGLTPTYKTDMSASDTYFVANDGRTFLHCTNSGGSDSVITVVTPGTVDGQAVADKTFTVAQTSGNKMIGPFPPNLYNAAGEFSFTLTNATDVDCAVFRMPI